MVEFLNISGVCEGFLEDGSVSEHFSDLWRYSRRWLNFWTFLASVKVFLKMGQFLNVFQICEGFLEDGSISYICEGILEDGWISEHFWRLWRFSWSWLNFLNISDIFLEDGWIYERFWHFWMFCGGLINFLHWWRYSRRWLNFWMFLAFLNVL